jgi:hypothetical protein
MNLLSSLNSIVFTSLLDSDLCPELEGYRKKDQIEEDEVMIYLKTIRELQDQNLPFDMVKKKRKKVPLLLCGMQQELLNFLVGAHLLSSRIRIHAAL